MGVVRRQGVLWVLDLDGADVFTQTNEGKGPTLAMECIQIHCVVVSLGVGL